MGIIPEDDRRAKTTQVRQEDNDSHLLAKQIILVPDVIRLETEQLHTAQNIDTGSWDKVQLPDKYVISPTLLWKQTWDMLILLMVTPVTSRITVQQLANSPSIM